MLSRFLHIIIVCSGLSLFVGCERDFDELNDTNQRHIEFNFNTDYLFSEILHYDGESYYLDGVDELPEGHVIRVTSYCYDESDSLVSKSVQMADLNSYSSVKFKHLDKDSSYNFIFIADVVKVDAYVGFYEVWYQMSSKSLNDFYIYSDYRSDSFVENIIGSATFINMNPHNQTYTVDFIPLAYNGYCVFKNLEDVSLLTCVFYDTLSYTFYNMETIKRASLGYQFEFSQFDSDQIIVPLTFSTVDDAISIRVNTIVKQEGSTNNVRFETPNHRPFIIEIDCKTLTLEKVTFIE